MILFLFCTRFIAKRGNFGESVVIEDGDVSHKHGIVKYMVGNSDLGLENASAIGLSQRGCLSEKSSDSGVSSSSLSSAPPPRDKNLAVASATEQSKSFIHLSRNSPTSQSTTTLKSQYNDGSYQWTRWVASSALTTHLRFTRSFLCINCFVRWKCFIEFNYKIIVKKRNK